MNNLALTKKRIKKAERLHAAQLAATQNGMLIAYRRSAFEEGQKLFYITQTTLSLDDVREVTQALKKKFPQVETLPSSSIS